MEPTVCRLPKTDRAQRTADFQALFANALVGRQRAAGVVRWTLRAGANTLAESRRLAALEMRCCDGITIDVDGSDDAVVWEISGPASAAALLDVFYQLPELVAGDQDATQLWAVLDAAGCSGPPANRAD